MDSEEIMEREEEEVMVSLRERQSRRTSDSIVKQAPLSRNVSVEEENGVHADAVVAYEDQFQAGSETGNSVYFDTNDGTWKCRHCTWTYQMGSPGIDHTQNPNGHCHRPMNIKTLIQQGPCFGIENKGTESSNGPGGMKFGAVDCCVAEKKLGNEESDFNINDPGAKKSLTNGNNHQSHENLKYEQQSGLHLILSGKSIENGTTSFDLVNSSAHIEVVKESKQEIAEWEVEKVLEEQDTHDLYCPNCNSCITKRIILRKRKRRIQNIQYDNKREKIDEPVAQLGLDDLPSTLLTNDQGQDRIESGLDRDPHAPEINDRDQDAGPDIFRCLTCFSLFIPTVCGFKFFRIFRGRGESQNMQSPPQILDENKAGLSGESENLQSPPQIPARNQAGERENHVLQENHTVELLNSLPYMDKTLPFENNDTFSIIPEAQLPGHSNTGKHEDNSKWEVLKAKKDILISLEQEALLPQDRQSDIRKDLEGSPKNSSAGVQLPSHSKSGKQEDKSKWEPLKADKDVLISFEQEALLPQDIITDVGKYLEVSAKNSGAGNDVLQDNHMVELLKSPPFKDKSPPYENNDSVSIIPGTQLLGHSNIGKKDDNSKLEPLTTDKDVLISLEKEALPPQDKQADFGKDLEGSPKIVGAVNDVILLVDRDRPGTSQSVQNVNSLPASEILVGGETEPLVGEQRVDQPKRSREWDILKSIVYGGLVESITSLGVISSAAGGDATTMNIVALGLANLVGGLFIIAHGLRDLKNEHEGVTIQNEKVDRYQEVLGQRMNFRLHATVAVLSYIVFGLLPPVIYGFSFLKSNNKEYKLIAVAAASLLCIVLLAIGKAHVQKPPKSYTRTILYFFSMGLMASGLSYVVGVMINKFLEKLGLFETSSAAQASSSLFLDTVSKKPAWASY